MSIAFKIVILVIYILAFAGCLFWWKKEGGWEPKVATLTMLATLVLFVYDYSKDSKKESENSIAVSENKNSPFANNIETQNNYYSKIDSSILNKVLEPKKENDKKGDKNLSVSKKVESKQEQKIGDINIIDNKGNAQVNVNSPGSKQIINEKRVIRNNVSVEKARKNDLYLLRLTFLQTDGIWDVGQKFWLQLQLTGPYNDFKFLSGFPSALFNVRTTQGIVEAANKGWIEFETTTPPLNESIVLEIESINEVNVERISLQPTDGYGNQ